ncbi:DUF3341 domain-containing protein [Fimbriiglobus ruber]|uniref:ABC-type Fe3+ transport system protein n=1 Tax=Fimbriiglobus ruber TaxID=1908690 RepID=A0A225D969_9BACT|nr:DUF3341 domain-containing protein [Fimbriiglobus ruber]OWK36194.1 ABC-type Fe3+ transport system protein [Fimbriiglobus ruber]
MTHAHDDTAAPATYGVMAEFGTGDDLIAATRKAAAAGYTRMDGYSPYPIGEVADALGFPRSEIGAIMFIGALCGATFGFLLQFWANGIDYPLNVGGKPFFSWPMFAPITWELLVLTASLSGVIGLFALCGLPQPYHPVFNVPQFARATRDRFFLCIEAVDPLFDTTAKTTTFLATLNPISIEEVPE